MQGPLLSPETSHLPNCQAPSLQAPSPQKDVGPRTRRTERDRSRRGWSHPEHRGSAARGWTRPRLAMPSRRRMCGWWRRRVRHFAAERRISLGPGPERRQNIAAKFERRPTSSPRRRIGAATAAKAQLSFAGGRPRRLTGRVGGDGPKGVGRVGCAEVDSLRRLCSRQRGRRRRACSGGGRSGTSCDGIGGRLQLEGDNCNKLQLRGGEIEAEVDEGLRSQT